MLKLIWFITNLLLIIVIFFYVPKESIGLSASLNSSERLLNILTGLGIILYFGIALQLNFAEIHLKF